MTGLAICMSYEIKVPYARRSAPAQKARPSPVRMLTLRKVDQSHPRHTLLKTYQRLGSSSNHVRILSISESMAGVMAFRDFGLFKVNNMICSAGNETLISFE